MNYMANSAQSHTSHLVQRIRYPDGTKRDKCSLHDADMLESFGKAVSLMMNSAVHTALSVGDLRRLLLPAMQNRQFRIVERSGLPIGYASWAFVSPEVEKRLCTGDMRLLPDEWRCGNLPWLVDLIAPYGNARYILTDLKQSVFSGMRVKTLRQMSQGGDVQVCHL